MSYFVNEEKQELRIGRIIGTVLSILIGASIVFGSFGTVGAGEQGVRVRFGKVTGSVDPGLYFKVPFIEKVVRMEVKTRTVNYDRNGNEGDTSETSALAGASRDLQDVLIGVVVNYHVNPDSAGDIYSQYKSVANFEIGVIEPIIREAVKSTSAQYTAEELVTKRAEYGDKVNAILLERFATKDAILERFSVTNFEFSKAFTQSIEAKVTAVQNAEAAKNKLEQVRYEAEQRVTQAKGEAEAIRIQAQAITQQGGAEYVNLKAVEKWNGVLPQYQLSNTTPFLNIK